MKKEYVVLGLGVVFIASIAYLAFQEVEDHPAVVGIAAASFITIFVLEKGIIKIPAVVG